MAKNSKLTSLDCSKMEKNIISPQEKMIFDSYEELEKFVDNYCQQIKIYFVKIHSTKINPPDQKIVYSNIEYGCKFGGERQSQATGQRISRTYCYGCPAFFKIRSTKDNKLEIYWTRLSHKNHPDNAEDFFFAIPQNRKLPPAVLDEMLQMLKMGCKYPKIKNHIKEKYDIFLENKDIQNKKATLKNPNGNDLDELIKILKENDCLIDIFRDTKNRFKGIYFSTPSMRNAMATWPNMIFVDGTYSLLNLRYILLLIIVQNNMGRSVIVGAAIVKSEDGETFDWFIKTFITQNPKVCLDIKCIMSDKNQAQRNAFEKFLPNAKRYLCVFHTLQSFTREMNKLNLTKETSTYCLQLLKKLVYSSSSKEYDRLYLTLKKTAPTSVVQYFNNNWHPIKNEWAVFNMKDGNSGQFTNNALESTNRHIKRVCERHQNLVNFATDFFEFYKSQCQEINLVKARQCLRRPLLSKNIDEEVTKYANYLTKKGMEKLLPQLQSHSKIEFTEIDDDKQMCRSEFRENEFHTTTSTCTCAFFSSFGLPCCHIFAVRKHFNLTLFSEELCGARWSKLYDENNRHSLQSKSWKNSKKNSAPINFSVAASKKVMTVGERFRRLQVVTNELASIGSTSTGDEFEKKEQLLETIRNAWSNGLDIEVTVRSSENEISDGVSNLKLSEKKNNELSKEEDIIRSIIQPTPTKLRGRPRGIHQTTPQHFSKKKSHQRSTKN